MDGQLVDGLACIWFLCGINFKSSELDNVTKVVDGIAEELNYFRLIVAPISPSGVRASST